MPEKLSIALVDADGSVRKMLRSQLDKMENIKLVSESKQIDQAFEMVGRIKPDVLILELPQNATNTLRWTERIKIEFPDTAIFVSSAVRTPELIISAMRAGAQEFLNQPVDPDELKKAIEKIFVTKEKIKAQVPEKGRIISVFSKKGGLGVTTLAVNLGVALSQMAEKKTALIDLDLQFGDITSFLNLFPEYSIIDVCDKNGGVDEVKLQSCMTRHQSGVFALAEPKNPAESENISPSQINQVLRHLKSMFSYVIVDTPHIFDSKTLEAFELSDHIILVTVPNISSIRATKKALGVFRDLGYAPDKVRVIVNRVGKKDPIKAEAIEKTIHYPVSWVIPNNYPAVIEAINTGIPLLNHKGGSNVAKSIQDLAVDIPKWSRTLYVELKEKE
jgi:pilus assembly protein CpaE